MLGDDLVKLLEAAGQSLREQARTDHELREALTRVGRWLLECAEPGEQAAEESRSIGVGDGAVLHGDGEATSARPSIATTLRIGDEEAEIVVPRPQEPPRLIEPAQPTITGPRLASTPPPAHRQPDLGLINKRCDLKSSACRWAIVRRRRIEEGADFQAAIAPTDHDLISRAKELPSCYLWMLDPYGVLPPEDPVLNVIDACYINLGDAALLVRDVKRRQDENGGSGAAPGIEEPVRMLAEAQSALRVAITSAGVKSDQDQVDAFAWLKEFTYAERIYLDRFMRLDSAADPQNWSDLHDRIESMRDEMESSSALQTRRTKLLNRARYHARKLDDGDLDDWRKILDSIDELVTGMGVPPSDLEVREILLPLIDEIPEQIELGAGAGQAVREVDRYVASREAAREVTSPAAREVTDEVRRVTELLLGTTIVLIGGDERPEASRAIERAFELDKLRWISAKPHQSITTFEPEVARAETALVMLAIRFSSHSFEGVKAMCERYGKPFVRLPGGYGVNQIARQILDQVGNRLASASA